MTREKTEDNARKTFYKAVLKSAGIDFKSDDDSVPVFKKYFSTYSEGDTILKTSADGKDLVIKISGQRTLGNNYRCTGTVIRS